MWRSQHQPHKSLRPYSLQHCDRPQVVGCDRFLFRRLCYECRDLNLVPTTDVGKGKTYRDLHPATLQAVTATPRERSFPLGGARLSSNPRFSAVPPRDLRYARHQRSWVLIGDLRDASETLELLQLEDDAESLNKYVETTSLSAKSVQKTLGRAKRLKSSWSVARTKRGEALEAGLAKKYSPRVKQYVLERLAIKEEHAKVRSAAAFCAFSIHAAHNHGAQLTDWIRMRWTSLIERQDVVRIESSTFESCVQRYRMDACVCSLVVSWARELTCGSSAFASISRAKASFPRRREPLLRSPFPPRR